jgi:hypothetical protein
LKLEPRKQEQRMEMSLDGYWEQTTRGRSTRGLRRLVRLKRVPRKQEHLTALSWDDCSEQMRLEPMRQVHLKQEQTKPVHWKLGRRKLVHLKQVPRKQGLTTQGHSRQEPSWGGGWERMRCQWERWKQVPRKLVHLREELNSGDCWGQTR